MAPALRLTIHMTSLVRPLDSGFGDISYFNHAFRKRYGLTPSGVRCLAEPADTSGTLTHTKLYL